MQFPDFFHFIPFVGMVTDKIGVERPLLTTIFEKVILSAIGGLLAVYISVKVMESEISQLHSDIIDLRASVNEMRHDLYVPRGEKR